jgi:hypothetical protein
MSSHLAHAIDQQMSEVFLLNGSIVAAGGVAPSQSALVFLDGQV